MLLIKCNENDQENGQEQDGRMKLKRVWKKEDSAGNKQKRRRNGKMIEEDGEAMGTPRSSC